MKLTRKQKENMQDILSEYEFYLEGKEINEENVAAVMMVVCGELDWVTALSISRRIHSGAENVCQLTQDKEALRDPDAFIQTIEKLTAHLDEGQRKGLLLQCLDALSRKETDGKALCERAALSVEELEDLLAWKVHRLAESMMEGMETVTGREGILREKPKADTEESEDAAHDRAFLMAAVQYTAALRGILPREFAQYPELAAICSETLLQAMEYTAGEGKDEPKSIARRVVENILMIGVGTALMTGAVLAVQLGDGLFWALESGIFSALCLSFLSVALVCAFLGGEVLVFLGISNLMDIYRERKNDRENPEELQEEASQNTMRREQDTEEAGPGEWETYDEEVYV